jgi:hypothetical protein
MRPELKIRRCPQAPEARRFRFGRFLPVLLAFAMLGNLLDCVRVEQRGPASMQMARRRRTRGGRWVAD